MENGERQLYLPPDQQLLIGARVNRLCELEPDKFDPAFHLDEVRSIIEALDPRMEESSITQFTLVEKHKSDSTVATGATDHGNISTSFHSDQTKELRIGVKEYRIGAYVATKQTNRDSTFLIFEHFWDRREIDEIFERQKKQTEIGYDKESLEPFSVRQATSHSPEIDFKLGKIRVRISLRERYERITLWEIPPEHSLPAISLWEKFHRRFLDKTK